MKKIYITIIFLFLVLNPLYSQLQYKHDQSFIPDFVVSQFAGYIGFVSSGVGYNFYDESLKLELLYGYVPKSAGGISIHMFTCRGSYSLSHYRTLSGFLFSPLNFSFFVNYARGNQYVLRWSPNYPKRYYRPTSIYTGESIGMSIKKSCENSIIKGYEFYGDVVTMSEYLYEYCKNETVTLKDIISLAFGVRFYFL